MPRTSKSSVIPTNPKPTNVFYIWYAELCRRLNINPIAIYRPAKARQATVLNFSADRLKLEDWSPLINALRHDTSLHVINIRSRMTDRQFLYDVDTEDKARNLRNKYGALWTDYILNSLLRALSYSLRNTQVLTYLVLDGFPMFTQYLEGLLKGLKENKTVKHLSFTNCRIQDTGCRSVCFSLQAIPNIETLNVSNCELTAVSGIYIAKLIKSQQLNRYTTSWHKSLRYSEPDAEKLCGIKRITLNSNPGIGNEGFYHILNELEDDLWIEALDMQKCGITEDIASKMLDVLNYNKSLRIFDLRKNEDLNQSTLELILDILRHKKIEDDSPSNFQWCDSVDTYSQSTVPISSRENLTYRKNESETSLPLATRGREGHIKTQTAVDLIRKNIDNCASNVKPYDLTKKKLMQLSGQNVQDVSKKQSSQNFNDNIRRSLKTCYVDGEVQSSNTLSSVLKTLGKYTGVKVQKAARNDSTKNQTYSKYSDRVKKESKDMENNHKIRNSPNFRKPNRASDLFALYLDAQKDNSSTSSDDRLSLLGYVDQNADILRKRNVHDKNLKKIQLSKSQLSLIKYKEELQHDKTKSPSDPRKVSLKCRKRRTKNPMK